MLYYDQSTRSARFCSATNIQYIKSRLNPHAPLVVGLKMNFNIKFIQFMNL